MGSFSNFIYESIEDDIRRQQEVVANIFIRILQHNKLTFDSTNNEETIARPDLVYCEYDVPKEYTINNKFEPSIHILKVLKSFFIKPDGVTIRLRSLYREPCQGHEEGIMQSTLLRWHPRWHPLNNTDHQWLNMRDMCVEVFGTGVHVNSYIQALTVPLDVIPVIPKEIQSKYILRYINLPQNRMKAYNFEDPFEKGSKEKYE